MSVEISITDQIVEINETSTPVEIYVAAGAIISPVWGGITGTLSNQTDLQNALNAKYNNPTGTTLQYLRGDGTLATFPTITSGTVTSVGLSMPSAFTVANSPVTSSGTLAVTGAGSAAQYIRGDGQLANFPDNQGGGSSVSYYLNGSVTQGTFGGVTYYEMSKTPVLGAGTNFTRTNGQGNGYIASFITDAGDPSLLNIPSGNWNVEFYFQSSASGGSPQFYGELYKVDASNNFTLVGSGSTNPEGITNGTTVDQYFTSIPVPQTSLLVTDRLAIRIFVIPAGRTITLHTENSNLCEVVTTLSTGLNALNGLTSQVQYFATGTSGTDFAISSATDTHTFNLPTASATNRGALSSADWTTFNSKQNALTNPITGTGTSGQVAYFTGATTQAGNNFIFFDITNQRLGLGTITPQYQFHVAPQAFFNGGIRLGTGYSAIDVVTGASGLYLSGSQGALNHVLINSSGRLILGGGADSGQRLQVTGDALITSSVTAASFIPSGATVPTNGMYLAAANTLTFATNTSEKMRLDASGNLGLGVTPSAWSVLKGLQVGLTASVSGYGASTEGAFFSSNSFYDGGAFKYQVTGFATTYLQISGTHRWSTAASGTAGASITLTESMRLHTTGNLVLGGTVSSDSGEKLQVNGTAKITGNMQVGSSAPTSITGYTSFAVGNATNGGNIDLFTGATRHASWNNTATETYFGTRSNTPLAITTNATEVARFFNNGNFRVGAAAADSGERLQVTGTAKITGATNFTAPNNTADGGGQIFLNGSTGNRIDFNNVGANSPTNTTRSIGTKLVLYPNLNSSLVDYAIGIEGGAAWFSVPTNNAHAFKWYGGTTTQMSLTNGSLGIGGTPTASAILQADSTTKGFLPPRMTTTQKNAIATPAAGLMVYDTTLNQMSYYNATTWINF